MSDRFDAPLGSDPEDPADVAPESGAVERRSSERIPVTWSVDCETEDTFLYASIANISEMGIFVRTEEPLTVGTHLHLRFAPDASARAGGARSFVEFDLDGVVQWINPAKNGSPNPGMGIRFFHLTPEDRERIVEVIRTINYLPAGC